MGELLMPPSGSTTAVRSASAFVWVRLSSLASRTCQLSKETFLWCVRPIPVASRSCLQDVSCSQACVRRSSHQTCAAINLNILYRHLKRTDGSYVEDSKARSTRRQRARKPAGAQCASRTRNSGPYPQLRIFGSSRVVVCSFHRDSERCPMSTLPRYDLLK